ncbi:MAG: surface-adhesin E family protein [Betaproteobacteria bacterium]
MKTARWIATGLLFLATTAFAGEWSLVSQGKDEIVFLDRSSIHASGDLKKARVLRSFSTIQTIGDDAFPHKSEILLYAVRCEDRSLAFEQWTMTAGEIGTGATVWSGQVDSPSPYKDPGDPAFVSMITTVCSG